MTWSWRVGQLTPTGAKPNPDDTGLYRRTAFNTVLKVQAHRLRCIYQHGSAAASQSCSIVRPAAHAHALNMHMLLRHSTNAENGTVNVRLHPRHQNVSAFLILAPFSGVMCCKLPYSGDGEEGEGKGTATVGAKARTWPHIGDRLMPERCRLPSRSR